jgi:hypothetical protein
MFVAELKTVMLPDQTPLVKLPEFVGAIGTGAEAPML